MRGGALAVLLATVVGCTSATPSSTVVASITARTANDQASAESRLSEAPGPTIAKTAAAPRTGGPTTAGPIRAAGPTASPTRSPQARPAAAPESTDPEPTPTPSVRLMAVGDLMLGWGVGRKINNKGPAAPWMNVQQFFDQADVVVGNLECVISNRGTRWPTKRYHLRAPLKAAASLAVAGIDVVSVANNHSLDFGADAFGDTLDNLDAAGVLYAGGGPNATAAHAPAMVEDNGLRIAFLGYVLPFSSKTSFNTRHWEAGVNRAGLSIGTPDAVGRDVAALREAGTADLIVVMVHGGFELRSRPNAAQRAFASAALDAGATLVLGHHPHVLQGYLLRDDTLVAFSLGNFVFPGFDQQAANDSAILDVTLTAGGVATLGWIPVVMVKGVPRPATPAEAERILNRLKAL